MAALRTLHDSDIELEDIAMRQPNLDEVFLSLTGQPIEDSRLDGGSRRLTGNRKENQK